MNTMENMVKRKNDSFRNNLFCLVCLTTTVEPQPLRRLITPLLGVFAQAFFEKACVAPFDHAVFGQAFFKKGCDHAG